MNLVSAASKASNPPITWQDYSPGTPEYSLAMDEALLDACDAGEIASNLRFWEPPALFVVVGYSNDMDREVRMDQCRDRKIPVLRRCSGGGAVVQMPGVLNYNWVCPIPEAGPLATLSGTNVWVMERVRDAIGKLPGLSGRLSIRGATDLCVDGLKCAGNSQRRKRGALMFHGSLLLNAPLEEMESCLQMPSREPDYRGGRGHLEFCVNLNQPAELAKAALIESFGASTKLEHLPTSRAQQLIASRYGNAEWNRRGK